MKNILIDSGDFFFRSVMAWKGGNTAVPINYTYCNMLISALKRIGVDPEDRVFVCIDSRSWRKDYLLEYKANRKEARDAQADVIPWEKVFKDFDKLISQLDESTSFFYLREWNCEADDFIAHMTKIFAPEECIIVSRDADMKQLCARQNVKFFSTAVKCKGGNGAYCLTEDAQILTNKGWKYHHEIKKNTTVATYNTNTECIEYQQTRYIHRHEVDERLYNIKNSKLNIKCTENHNHIIKNTPNEIKIVASHQLKKKHKIILNGTDFKYSIRYYLGKEWAELIGWFIAEGYFMSNNEKSIGICQSLKANKKYYERIESLLKKCNIRYKKSSMKFIINKCPFNDWVHANLFPKKVPSLDLLDLPIADLRALLTGMIMGDGSFRSEKSFRFYQKNPKVIEFVEILAFRLGYSIRTVKKKNKDLFITSICPRKTIELTCSQITKKRYKGTVWCPTTPNRTWVCKQNGQVFITGNSLVKNPYQIISHKVAKGDIADNIIVRDTDTEDDVKVRELIINLLKLPEEIEQKVEAKLKALQPKENNMDKFPFKSLAKRFYDIYKKDKVVTWEDSMKAIERKKKRVAKRAKEKREAKKLEKTTKIKENN